MEPLRNGNILYLTTDFRAIEIDLLGNPVGSWYAAQRPQGEADGIGIPTLSMHHEIDELANGNLLVMGTELREFDNWYTSETDPQTGNVLVFYGSAATVTDTSLAWNNVMGPGGRRDRGTQSGIHTYASR